MNPSLVAVTTITWARSAAEEATLRRSLACLATLGLRVAVADKGNNPDFLQFLESLAGFRVTVSRDGGLVAQVQASVAVAADVGVPFVLYTEPDKESFFRRLPVFIGAAPSDDDVGVVLASRTDRSFETFPPMQRYTEGVLNHLCVEFIGCAGDYCYGPFLMHRSLLATVATIPRTLGWGWRPFMFKTAHDRGLRVVHLPAEYECPTADRLEHTSDRVLRLRQLSENIAGLIAAG